MYELGRKMYKSTHNKYKKEEDTQFIFIANEMVMKYIQFMTFYERRTKQKCCHVISGNINKADN